MTFRAIPILSVLICSLFLSIPGLEGQTLNDHVGTEKIGKYTRKWLFVFPLYEVSFYFSEKQRLLGLINAANKSEEELIDEIAGKLLDEQNNFELILIYKPLISMKSYRREKPVMQAALGRAGFSVDETWNLTENTSHQGDLNLYIRHLLGLDEDNPGVYYSTRRRGDVFTLTLTTADEAKVSYKPSSNNRNGLNGEFLMMRSGLLRGIISTYISYTSCSEELRDHLPKALLEGILKEFDY